MTTEAELVMGSLTLEELDECRAFVTVLERGWIAGTKDRGTGRYTGFRTDGPMHVLTAMKLAVLREMAGRGGAEPWYAGMPTDGHVAATILELYQRRYGLRPAEPRISPAGAAMRTCVACGEAKAQDGIHFERLDGLWDERCRECRRVDVGLIPPEALDVPPRPEPQPTDEALLELL